MSHIVSPFRQLLNRIAHDLSRQNLRSLLHICDYISEHRREGITHALDLFETLIQLNIIGEDDGQMQNLLDLMRKMRPERKDIIRIVKNYMRKNYSESIVSTSTESYNPGRIQENSYATLEGPSSSQHSVQFSHTATSSMPLIDSDSHQHYSWCCLCFDCKCIPRPVPDCVLFLCGFVCSGLAIFICILWFAKIPASLYKKLGDYGHVPVGASIMAVLLFFAMTFFVWLISRKCEEKCHRRRLYRLPQHYCSSVEIPQNSVTSGSVRSLPQSEKRSYKKRRRSESVSTALPGSATTDASFAIPDPLPRRPASIPPPASTQLSYPESCHGNVLTDEEGTSGNYASPSDFTSGEESEGPLTVVIAQQ